MEEIRCRMENSIRHSLLCMETELTEEEVFGCYENKMLLNTEISGVCRSASARQMGGAASAMMPRTRSVWSSSSRIGVSERTFSGASSSS